MNQKKYGIDEAMQLLWSSEAGFAADPDSDVECNTDTEENQMEFDGKPWHFLCQTILKVSLVYSLEANQLLNVTQWLFTIGYIV